MKNERLQILPIQFEEVNTIDNRYSFGKIYLLHTGKNLKGSFFQKSVVEDAFPSLMNTPVLGFIKVDEDNEKDFEGHKSILVVEDGDYKIKYAGQAYGVIPESCNPRWEMKTSDDGIEREYLVVDCILWSSKFSDVKDIFDRDIKKSQSMELDDNFSGFERSDGYFEFSSICFHGACILGNSRSPAMKGSTIEIKFSTEEFKNEIQSQMELLKFELKQLTQQTQDPSPLDNVDLNNINFQDDTKGGNDLDKVKFLELLSKYSNLSEDDCKDILSSLGTYSLETLDSKLKEMSDGKQTEFEMTHEQLRTAVYHALSEQKVIKKDYYGDPYESQLYHFMDIKDNNVIVIDNSWENYFGIPYTINGDSVMLDYTNKVEMLPDWRVKESGSTEFTLVKDIITEQIKFNVEKAEAKTKETYSVDGANSDVIVIETQEYKDLQSKFSTLEVENIDLQSKYSTLELEKSTLETKISEFEAENTELKAFQETTISKQRSDAENNLFEMFSEKLTEDELKPFKETAKDFTIEQLEEKLSAFAFKKIATFEFTKKPKVNIVADRKIEIKTGKPYDDILGQYISNE